LGCQLTSCIKGESLLEGLDAGSVLGETHTAHEADLRMSLEHLLHPGRHAYDDAPATCAHEDDPTECRDPLGDRLARVVAEAVRDAD
jgi:hypothetical protein